LFFGLVFPLTKQPDSLGFREPGCGLYKYTKNYWDTWWQPHPCIAALVASLFAFGEKRGKKKINIMSLRAIAWQSRSCSADENGRRLLRRSSSQWHGWEMLY